MFKPGFARGVLWVHCILPLAKGLGLHDWPIQISIALNQGMGLSSRESEKFSGKGWMPWYCRYHRKFLQLLSTLLTPSSVLFCSYITIYKNLYIIFLFVFCLSTMKCGLCKSTDVFISFLIDKSLVDSQ